MLRSHAWKTLALAALAMAGGGAPLALAQGAAPGPEMIAVLDLNPVQAGPAETLALSDRLREELLRSGRYTLVDRSQMDQVLQEQALQQTGCTEQECAVKVGQILGVRKIVAGKVIKVSDQIWMVSAMMVDVETARTERADSVRHQGDFFTLMDVAITSLAAKLASGLPATLVRAPAAAPAVAAVIAPTAGNRWTEPITGMEFVRVAGGTFEQGCGSWTASCDEDEKPTRQVTLKSFWLGKTEVTQAQWNRVMRNDSQGGLSGILGNNPSYHKGDTRPVENVRWTDAQEYIKRLNQQTQGSPFRLPTEAEWEYACRSGGRPLEYGTESGKITRQEANYGRDRCCEGDDSDGFTGTAPVASYHPNGLGLYDMTGNVWEWVLDRYDKTAYRSGAVSDPVNDRAGSERIFRGGGWFRPARDIRCTNRYRGDPDKRFPNVGFRLVRAE